MKNLLIYFLLITTTLSPLLSQIAVGDEHSSSMRVSRTGRQSVRRQIESLRTRVTRAEDDIRTNEETKTRLNLEINQNNPVPYNLSENACNCRAEVDSCNRPMADGGCAIAGPTPSASSAAGGASTPAPSIARFCVTPAHSNDCLKVYKTSACLDTLEENGRARVSQCWRVLKWQQVQGAESRIGTLRAQIESNNGQLARLEERLFEEDDGDCDGPECRGGGADKNNNVARTADRSPTLLDYAPYILGGLGMYLNYSNQAEWRDGMLGLAAQSQDIYSQNYANYAATAMRLDQSILPPTAMGGMFGSMLGAGAGGGLYNYQTAGLGNLGMGGFSGIGGQGAWGNIANMAMMGGLGGFSGLAAAGMGGGGLPGLNGSLGFNFGLNAGVPGFGGANSGLYAAMPGMYGAGGGVPGFNGMYSGMPGMYGAGGGVPGFNGMYSGMPGMFGAGGGVPGFNGMNGGMAGMFGAGGGVPGFNGMYSGMPGMFGAGGGIPGFNGMYSGMPGFNGAGLAGMYPAMAGAADGSSIFGNAGFNGSFVGNPLNAGFPGVQGLAGMGGMPMVPGFPGVINNSVAGPNVQGGPFSQQFPGGPLMYPGGPMALGNGANNPSVMNSYGQSAVYLQQQISNQQQQFVQQLYAGRMAELQATVQNMQSDRARYVQLLYSVQAATGQQQPANYYAAYAGQGSSIPKPPEYIPGQAPVPTGAVVPTPQATPNNFGIPSNGATTRTGTGF